MNVIKDKAELFRNPASYYGSLPFWSWNEALDEEEIIFQIKEMANQGVGGFFMHSRDGLETEYLSGKWMSCIKTAVEEASNNGMRAWLYDEDRWPSGTAGGKVPAESDAYRCKGLTLEVCKPEDVSYLSDDNVLAVYAADYTDMEIISCRRLLSNEATVLKDNERRLVVRLEVSGISEWFNNETPPDNLNPDTVRNFISKTHEIYASEVGEYFGTVIPGIFTDEPSLADFHTSFLPNRSWIPWTYGFEDYYKEKRSRDVFETLPYIYFNGSKSQKARHDYWNTVSELFCESYTQVISAWCKEHGLAYTGHFLQEDKLGLCTRVNGSIMPHYKYQDVPGIDLLGESTTEYLTVKQCSSVAHQFGQKEVLTETYGCTGWDFTFEGMKWVGDWQYVLGVNRMSKHLALYSLRGCRKRDYPPTFNYNTTWWEKNHVIEKYYARLSMILQEGEPIRKILILHPMSTAWSRLGVSPYGNPIRRLERDVPAVNEYGYEFNSFLEFMSRQHIDYDLGDEILMASDGKVIEKSFYIGKAAYETVIIPSIDTMKSYTLDLLLEFIDSGGHIIIKTPLPYLVEGEETDELDKLFNHVNCTVFDSNNEILAKIDELGLRDISITDRFGLQESKLLSQYRKSSTGGCLFVVNNDRVNSASVMITIPEVGDLEEWNVLTGEKIKLDVRYSKSSDNRIAKSNDKSCMEFMTEFKCCESKLFVWGSDEQTIDSKGNQSLVNRNNDDLDIGCNKKLYYEFPKTCDINLSMPNVLTLDKCRWRFVGGSWSEEMEVWRAQYEIREHLGMLQIHRNGLEQRYKWINTPHQKDGTEIELSFNFESDTSIALDAILLVERAKEFAYIVNGINIEYKDLGWFIDKEFKKALTFPVIKGNNEILISCAYRNDYELEACYILGDFAVSMDRKLIDTVKSLQIGDWTSQGLLHYPGKVLYHYNFHMEQDYQLKQWAIEINDFSAVCVTVLVNGKKYEVPWAAAGEVIITDAIKAGDNILEVEVYSSPRNMLGPFHLKDGDRRITNDASFTPTKDEYYAGYQVVPYGLNSPPRIYQL